jgi:hypothetical protein
VHIEKGVQFAGTCTIGPLDAPQAAEPTPRNADGAVKPAG